jgi:hypothetical protein
MNIGIGNEAAKFQSTVYSVLRRLTFALASTLLYGRDVDIIALLADVGKNGTGQGSSYNDSKKVWSSFLGLFHDPYIDSNVC